MAAVQFGHEPAVEAEADLREKNQITVPKKVVEKLGLREGDRFLFIVEEGDEDIVHLHRIRRSYAGALAGVYGTPEEIEEYIRGEHEAWNT
jgi:AbrB family looped-hinge helix DNA binding protein